MTPSIPHALVQSIRDGRCVAFLGAGFSQPLLPDWREMLGLLAASVPDCDLRQELVDWLSAHALSSRDYEGIAQTIHTALGDHFENTLRAALQTDSPKHNQDPVAHQQQRQLANKRLHLIQSIPFHSILTTNFDTLMEGKTPSPETFAEVIGARRRPWWAHQAWAHSTGRSDSSWHAPVVKLHGDLRQPNGHTQLVFTTRGYRRLVHTVPGYRAFLRTLFATHSVLYMGFSFSDAYINELRSEILALVGKERGDGRHQDYAIIADVPNRVAAHLRTHEGLECLTFSTNGQKDFTGFDHWLERITEQTSPQATLRSRVRGRRILWLDRASKGDQFGHQVLVGMAGSNGAHEVTTSENLTEALEAIAGVGPNFDLVITHFGYQPSGPCNAQRLIAGMRALPFSRHAPVIVFSDSSYGEQNRPLALKLGAFDYVTNWPNLFKAIENVFEPPHYGDPSR
ncbi:MAG: SIR2 family protein [Myxococcales bacterium]|nr:SIR2 family protein [Myxococcales bacterium]